MKALIFFKMVNVTVIFFIKYERESKEVYFLRVERECE